MVTCLILDHVNNSAAGPVYGFHIFAFHATYQYLMSAQLAIIQPPYADVIYGWSPTEHVPLLPLAAISALQNVP